MYNDQILGKRLTRLHESTGDSQEDAVKSIGSRTGMSIHQTTFSAYLRAAKSPTLPVLSALADYYNVSVDYLMGRADDSRPVWELLKRIEDTALPEQIEHAAKLLSELTEKQQKSFVAQIEEAHERKENHEALDYLAKFFNMDVDRFYRLIRDTPVSEASSILQSATELMRH